MPSATLTRNDPLPQLTESDHPLGEDAQRALDWLARTARWQRRLDELRNDSV